MRQSKQVSALRKEKEKRKLEVLVLSVAPFARAERFGVVDELESADSLARERVDHVTARRDGDDALKKEMHSASRFRTRLSRPTGDETSLGQKVIFLATRRRPFFLLRTMLRRRE